MCILIPILHGGEWGGGGGWEAQSTCANLKDSYLRNKYRYSTDIW